MDRPAHGRNRTIDQDYHFKVDPWTDFFTMDRPPHGRIWTLDQDYNFEVDEWTYFKTWTVHLTDGFELISLVYLNFNFTADFGRDKLRRCDLGKDVLLQLDTPSYQ